MRELDELLSGYLDAAWDAAPAAEKSAFEGLLTLSDPELLGYLLGNQPPPERFDGVIARILGRPPA